MSAQNTVARALAQKELKRLLVLVRERYGQRMGNLQEEKQREETYRLCDIMKILQKPPENETLAEGAIILARLVLNDRYKELDPLYRLYKLAEELLSAQAQQQPPAEREKTAVPAA